MNQITRIPKSSKGCVVNYPKTLDFIDVHFKDTPLGEINTDSISKKLIELSKNAKDAFTCTYYAGIAHEFDSTHDCIGKILLYAYGKAKCYKEKNHVFKVAHQINQSFLFKYMDLVHSGNE